MSRDKKETTVQFGIRGLLIFAFVGLLGCAEQTEQTEQGDESMTTIQVTSDAFEEGKPIPKKYTGEGEDVSPDLAWSGVPEGTKELALICDDPNAPTPEPWVHWVLYKLPADCKSLNEGIAPDEQLDEPAGAIQGNNSWPAAEAIGYRGPMPPPGHGTHHYYFRVYALDTELTLEPGATKNELLDIMRDHILGEGVLMGTYER